MEPSNPSVVLYGPGNAKIEDRPEPSITDPTDAIVRIKFVGVCGSDVHFWTNGGVGDNVVSASQPLVMGHEASGTIHAVGPGVSHLKPGDRVAIEPGQPCRSCMRCKEGFYNLCQDMKFAACPPDSPGCLSKYFKIPADFCYKLPPHVSLQEGVLAEPLAVAAHAVRMVGVQPGQSVVILGSGTIGLACSVVARLYGARKIVAVDLVDEKLEFARGFNNVSTFEPDLNATPEENARRLIQENQLGPGADAAIEATGSESSIATAVHVLRPGGSFVQTGLGKPVVNFPILAMSEKELHVHGAFRYSAGDFKIAMDVLEDSIAPMRSLISRIFDFEHAPQAWEATKQGQGIKNMIRGYGYRDSARMVNL
ncbi:putative D-xylulose reductase A [Exophiala dermatitidis]|uniref:D-xylulose reductase n=2 Tax=Exophiala dermatitidis (strain ATCC 34100 / CBS 525.76 / NIH/UT8656) TaxID=858893 RepID=H6BPK9_EXODN|nr:L-iditol 2-dehydrogenase [Exophiala dermatitidis NIH/UT8656]EHY53612.1 L-iditol 2-dehydrogenase [Exophiala dermatitidis NIH/UT8656]